MSNIVDEGISAELTKRDLVTVVSQLGQDLRDPLQLFVTGLELLENGGDSARVLAAMRRQADVLATMIDEMLKLERCTQVSERDCE